MDILFDLVMMDSSFYRKFDDYNTALNTRVDAIITSDLGGKAAIKSATVVHCRGLDLTILGGIFVLKDEIKKLQNKPHDDQSLKRFQTIDLED